MSIQSIQDNLNRVQSDIASLNVKYADAGRKESDKSARIVQIQNSISKSTSASSLQSKMREISRIENDIANIHKDKANISKRIADKEKDRTRYQQDLFREQERERQKNAAAETRR